MNVIELILKFSILWISFWNNKNRNIKNVVTIKFFWIILLDCASWLHLPLLTKIIELKIDSVSTVICQQFSYCLSIGKFLNELIHAMLYQSKKKRINVIKPTTSLLVFFQTFELFMRRLFIINFMNTSMTSYFLFNLGFVKEYNSQHSLLAMTGK